MESQYKQNTLRHWYLGECEWNDDSPYKLPEYEAIRAEYYKPINIKGLSKKDMVLVVADYCDYYFEKLIYQNPDGSEGDYSGYPHIGTYTDIYTVVVQL